MAGTDPTAAIIWLHGLGDEAAGANTQNLKKRVLENPALAHVKFATPQAPQRRVTCDEGIVEPAWFDLLVCPITASSLTGKEEDVLKAVAALHALIDAEVASGIPSERIVIGGFSQGAATTLMSAASYPGALAGAAGLWGWVPAKRELLAARAADAAKRTPLLWCHSRSDDVVTFDCAETGVETLRGLGFSVELQAYDGHGHNPHTEETEFLVGWLASRLPE